MIPQRRWNKGYAVNILSFLKLLHHLSHTFRSTERLHHVDT